MVTICLQCGDKGFTNAYVFCVKCLEVAVHRYCLDKIPKTFDEFVYWVCDYCEAGVPSELTLSNSDATPLENCTSPRHLKASSEAKLDVPPFLGKKDVISGSSEQFHKVQRRIDCNERTQVADLSPLPAKLSNGEIDSSLVKMVAQRFQPCSFKPPHEANTQFGAVGDCSSMIEKGSILSSDECHGKESERDRILLPQSRTALNGDDSQPMEGELPKEIIFVVQQQAEPVYDPIWRGGFNIWNKERDILGGLVAHVSVKACQKVFEEANLFPPLLHLEMLPKSEIWPKSFGTSEPADDNIALYFFPLDARRERDFDRLVEEMIGEELALRAVVTNAELLVFTSTELPLIHWRFQGKHYLWGVFRSKQGSGSCQMLSNGISSATLQTPENILAVRDQRDLQKAKTWNAESPLSPLSNNASLGSGSC